jgi:hypothetical protein
MRTRYPYLIRCLAVVRAKMDAGIGRSVRARKRDTSGQRLGTRACDCELNADGIKLSTANVLTAVQGKDLVAQNL